MQSNYKTNAVKTDENQKPIVPADHEAKKQRPARQPIEQKETAGKVSAPVIGVVTACQKLNLREEADGDAKVLDVLPVLTEVTVDLDASADDFYKVCTAAGIQGFCMKKHIAIRR